MVSMCCVPRCGNCSTDNVSLHIFPKDLCIKDKWIDAIMQRAGKYEVNGKHWTGPSQQRNWSSQLVCSEHFDVESFTLTCRLHWQEGMPYRTMLVDGAVPSLFGDEVNRYREQHPVMKVAFPKRVSADDRDILKTTMEETTPVPNPDVKPLALYRHFLPPPNSSTDYRAPMQVEMSDIQQQEAGTSEDMADDSGEILDYTVVNALDSSDESDTNYEEMDEDDHGPLLSDEVVSETTPSKDEGMQASTGEYTINTIEDTCMINDVAVNISNPNQGDDHLTILNLPIKQEADVIEDAPLFLQTVNGRPSVSSHQEHLAGISNRSLAPLDLLQNLVDDSDRSQNLQQNQLGISDRSPNLQQNLVGISHSSPILQQSPVGINDMSPNRQQNLVSISHRSPILQQSPVGINDISPNRQQNLLNISDGSRAPPNLQQNLFGIGNRSVAPPNLQQNVFGIGNTRLAPPNLQQNLFGIGNRSVAPPNLQQNVFGIGNRTLAPPNLQQNLFGIGNRSLAPPNLQQNLFGIGNRSLAPPNHQQNLFGIGNRSLTPQHLQQNLFGIGNRSLAPPNHEQNLFGISNRSLVHPNLQQNLVGIGNRSFAPPNLQQNMFGIGNRSVAPPNLQQNQFGIDNRSFAPPNLQQNLVGIGNRSFPHPNLQENMVGIGIRSLTPANLQQDHIDIGNSSLAPQNCLSFDQQHPVGISDKSLTSPNRLSSDQQYLLDTNNKSLVPPAVDTAASGFGVGAETVVKQEPICYIETVTELSPNCVQVKEEPLEYGFGRYGASVNVPQNTPSVIAATGDSNGFKCQACYVCFKDRVKFLDHMYSCKGRIIDKCNVTFKHCTVNMGIPSDDANDVDSMRDLYSVTAGKPKASRKRKHDLNSDAAGHLHTLPAAKKVYKDKSPALFRKPGKAGCIYRDDVGVWASAFTSGSDELIEHCMSVHHSKCMKCKDRYLVCRFPKCSFTTTTKTSLTRHIESKHEYQSSDCICMYKKRRQNKKVDSEPVKPSKKVLTSTSVGKIVKTNTAKTATKLKGAGLSKRPGQSISAKKQVTIIKNKPNKACIIKKISKETKLKVSVRSLSPKKQRTLVDKLPKRIIKKIATKIQVKKSVKRISNRETAPVLEKKAIKIRRPRKKGTARDSNTNLQASCAIDNIEQIGSADVTSDGIVDNRLRPTPYRRSSQLTHLAEEQSKPTRRKRKPLQKFQAVIQTKIKRKYSKLRKTISKKSEPNETIRKASGPKETIRKKRGPKPRITKHDSFSLITPKIEPEEQKPPIKEVAVERDSLGRIRIEPNIELVMKSNDGKYPDKFKCDRPECEQRTFASKGELKSHLIVEHPQKMTPKTTMPKFTKAEKARLIRLESTALEKKKLSFLNALANNTAYQVNVVNPVQDTKKELPHETDSPTKKAEHSQAETSDSVQDMTSADEAVRSESDALTKKADRPEVSKFEALQDTSNAEDVRASESDALITKADNHEVSDADTVDYMSSADEDVVPKITILRKKAKQSLRKKEKWLIRKIAKKSLIKKVKQSEFDVTAAIQQTNDVSAEDKRQDQSDDNCEPISEATDVSKPSKEKEEEPVQTDESECETEEEENLTTDTEDDVRTKIKVKLKSPADKKPNITESDRLEKIRKFRCKHDDCIDLAPFDSKKEMQDHIKLYHALLSNFKSIAIFTCHKNDCGFVCKKEEALIDHKKATHWKEDEQKITEEGDGSDIQSRLYDQVVVKQLFECRVCCSVCETHDEAVTHEMACKKREFINHMLRRASVSSSPTKNPIGEKVEDGIKDDITDDGNKEGNDTKSETNIKNGSKQATDSVKPGETKNAETSGNNPPGGGAVKCHSREDGFKCKYCDKSFISTNEFLTHVDMFHQDAASEPGSTKCRFCNKAFAVAGTQLYHEKLFHYDKYMSFVNFPFRCLRRGCHAKYSTKENLDEHIEAHEEFTHECDIDGCTRVFRHIKGLEKHKSENHNNKCSHCSFETKNYRVLQKHLDESHSKRGLMCQESGCGKYFETPEILKDHTKTHMVLNTELLPYHCNYKDCKEAFMYKKDLCKHVDNEHQAERMLINKFIRKQQAALAKELKLRIQMKMESVANEIMNDALQMETVGLQPVEFDTLATENYNRARQAEQEEVQEPASVDTIQIKQEPI